LLDRNVKWVDLSLTHWRRLTELVYGQPDKRRLILVHENGVPVQYFDTQLGAQPLPKVKVEDAQSLAERLAHENPDVWEVQVLDPEALRKNLSSLHADLRQDLDSDEFAFLLSEARAKAPGLGIAPKRDFLWHGVPIERLKKFVDLILPESCTYVLAVFDEIGVWASLLVQFENKKIVGISTFDALPAEELEGINGRDQHPYLLSLVANTFKRPTFGWFVDREDFVSYMKAPSVEQKDEIFQQALVAKRATFDYSILVERSVRVVSPIDPGPAAVQGK
jgi:hypothetical protein